MEGYKLYEWYGDYKIIGKRISNGKTSYDITDNYGERLYGLSKKDLDDYVTNYKIRENKNGYKIW